MYTAFYNITDNPVVVTPSPSRFVTLVNKGDFTSLTDEEWEFVQKAQPGIEKVLSKTNPKATTTKSTSK